MSAAATARVVRAAAAYRSAVAANAHSRAPLYPGYFDELVAALDALTLANVEVAEPGDAPDPDTKNGPRGGGGG